jgi:type I restriction enzyme R subunit
MKGVKHVLTLPPNAQEQPEGRKKRYLESSTARKRAFALSIPHEDAIAIRDEVGSMLAVAGLLNKVGTSTGGPTQYDDVDTANS